MTSFRDAATAFWGPAGEYAYAAYSRIRTDLFPDLPPEIPIVIGIIAYGRCIGLTRCFDPPRITIASNLFAQGHRAVDDVLVHEMLHVSLYTSGRDPSHAGPYWYAAVGRLSPAVLSRELDITRGGDRKSVRMANPRAGEEGQPATVVRKIRVADAVPHAAVAGWPGSFRSVDYDWGPPIDCPSY